MTRDEFQQIVPRLRFAMVRTGRDFFGNQADAEDVAQDGLVRMWTYCERLDAHRNLESLAVTVAKNICVERYKARQPNRVPIEMEPPAQASYEADAHLRAEEAGQRIDQVLGTLSPREEQLVRKRHLEDKSAEEIANETGLPKTSVKSMLSMARAKLKKRFQQ